MNTFRTAVAIFLLLIMIVIVFYMAGYGWRIGTLIAERSI